MSTAFDFQEVIVLIKIIPFPKQVNACTLDIHAAKCYQYITEEYHVNSKYFTRTTGPQLLGYLGRCMGFNLFPTAVNGNFAFGFSMHNVKEIDHSKGFHYRCSRNAKIKMLCMDMAV